MIQRGVDKEYDCTNSTALNLVDAYAIHLRYVGQTSQTPIAKYANLASTGYEVRLFDVDLTATPATFKMKLERTFTASLDPNKVIEAMLYTQITDTDYPDNDFRPATAWTRVDETSAELVDTSKLVVT